MLLNFLYFATSLLYFDFVLFRTLEHSRDLAISDSCIGFIMLLIDRRYAIAIDTMLSHCVHGHTLPGVTRIRLFCISKCSLLEVFSE